MDKRLVVELASDIEQLRKGFLEAKSLTKNYHDYAKQSGNDLFAFEKDIQGKTAAEIIKARQKSMANLDTEYKKALDKAKGNGLELRKIDEQYYKNKKILVESSEKEINAARQRFQEQAANQIRAAQQQGVGAVKAAKAQIIQELKSQYQLEIQMAKQAGDSVANIRRSQKAGIASVKGMGGGGGGQLELPSGGGIGKMIGGDALGSVQGLTSALGPLNGAMARLGPAGIAAGLAIGGLALVIGSSTKAAVEFNDNIARTRTLLTDAQAEGLSGAMNKLRDSARETGTPIGELQKTIYNLISSVPVFANDLNAAAMAAENASKLGTALGASTDAVALAMGNLGNASNLNLAAMEDQKFVMDALAQTMNAGVIPAGEDLARNIAKAAPALAQLSVNGREAVKVNGTLTALFTQNGLVVETAQDRIKAFTVSLLDASTRSKLLKAGLQGVNEAGKVTDWEALATSLGKNVAQFTNISGVAAESAEAMRLIGKNGGKAFADVAAGFDTMGGMADRMFGIMENTSEVAWKKVNANVQDALISIGQNFTPLESAIGNMAQNLTGWLADSLRSTDDQFNKLVATAEGFSNTADSAGAAVAKLDSAMASGNADKQKQALEGMKQVMGDIGKTLGPGVAKQLDDIVRSSLPLPEKMQLFRATLENAKNMAESFAQANYFDAQAKAAESFNDILDKQAGWWDEIATVGLGAIGKIVGALGPVGGLIGSIFGLDAGEKLGENLQADVFLNMSKGVEATKKQFDELVAKSKTLDKSSQEYKDTMAQITDVGQQLLEQQGNRAEIEKGLETFAKRTIDTQLQLNEGKMEQFDVESALALLLANTAKENKALSESAEFQKKAREEIEKQIGPQKEMAILKNEVKDLMVKANSEDKDAAAVAKERLGVIAVEAQTKGSVAAKVTEQLNLQGQLNELEKAGAEGTITRLQGLRACGEVLTAEQELQLGIAYETVSRINLANQNTDAEAATKAVLEEQTKEQKEQVKLAQEKNDLANIEVDKKLMALEMERDARANTKNPMDDIEFQEKSLELIKERIIAEQELLKTMGAQGASKKDIAEQEKKIMGLRRDITSGQRDITDKQAEKVKKAAEEAEKARDKENKAIEKAAKDRESAEKKDFEARAKARMDQVKATNERMEAERKLNSEIKKYAEQMEKTVANFNKTQINTVIQTLQGLLGPIEANKKALADLAEKNQEAVNNLKDQLKTQEDSLKEAKKQQAERKKELDVAKTPDQIMNARNQWQKATDEVKKYQEAVKETKGAIDELGGSEEAKLAKQITGLKFILDRQNAIVDLERQLAFELDPIRRETIDAQIAQATALYKQELAAQGLDEGQLLLALESLELNHKDIAGVKELTDGLRENLFLTGKTLKSRTSNLKALDDAIAKQQKLNEEAKKKTNEISPEKLAEVNNLKEKILDIDKQALELNSQTTDERMRLLDEEYKLLVSKRQEARYGTGEFTATQSLRLTQIEEEKQLVQNIADLAAKLRTEESGGIKVDRNKYTEMELQRADDYNKLKAKLNEILGEQARLKDQVASGDIKAIEEQQRLNEEYKNGVKRLNDLNETKQKALEPVSSTLTDQIDAATERQVFNNERIAKLQSQMGEDQQENLGRQKLIALHAEDNVKKEEEKLRLLEESGYHTKLTKEEQDQLNQEIENSNKALEGFKNQAKQSKEEVEATKKALEDWAKSTLKATKDQSMEGMAENLKDQFKAIKFAFKSGNQELKAEAIAGIANLLQSAATIAEQGIQNIKGIIGDFKGGATGAGVQKIGDMTTQIGQALLMAPSPQLKTAGAVILGIGMITKAVGRVIEAIKGREQTALEKAEGRFKAQEKITREYEAQKARLDDIAELEGAALDQARERLAEEKRIHDEMVAQDQLATYMAQRSDKYLADKKASLEKEKSDNEELLALAEQMREMGRDDRKKFLEDHGFNSKGNTKNRLEEAIAEIQAKGFDIDTWMEAATRELDYRKIVGGLSAQAREELKATAKFTLDQLIDMEADPKKIRQAFQNLKAVTVDELTDMLDEAGIAHTDLMAMSADEFQQFALELAKNAQFSENIRGITEEVLGLYKEEEETLKKTSEIEDTRFEKMRRWFDHQRKHLEYLNATEQITDEEYNTRLTALLQKQLAKEQAIFDELKAQGIKGQELMEQKQVLWDIEKEIWQLQHGETELQNEQLRAVKALNQERNRMVMAQKMGLGGDPAKLKAVEDEIIRKLQEAGATDEQIRLQRETFAATAPQYATGGRPKEGLAFLHDNEAVLNPGATKAFDTAMPGMIDSMNYQPSYEKLLGEIANNFYASQLGLERAKQQYFQNFNTEITLGSIVINAQPGQSERKIADFTWEKIKNELARRGIQVGQL